MEQHNFHPELIPFYNKFPVQLRDFGNLILHGPTGVGKYTQALSILKRYSPSELKYEKKMKIQTDKQDYMYHISDIHYEVDMSLLGCNSKIVWHELFLQIVDIISVKQEKIGIILCKNFHTIHNELLDIFYSYMQQYNNAAYNNILIKFIILTEHISFIPNNILNACKRLSVGRPNVESYMRMVSSNISQSEDPKRVFLQKITYTKSSTFLQKDVARVREIIKGIKPDTIMNTKEIKSFSLMRSSVDVPHDIFNIVCDNIIQEIVNHEKIAFAGFRDILYDILIYNLDVVECLRHIIYHFIRIRKIDHTNIRDIMIKTFEFLKFYNNNYRPIYHLESIFFYLIVKIYGYEDTGIL